MSRHGCLFSSSGVSLQKKAQQAGAEPCGCLASFPGVSPPAQTWASDRYSPPDHESVLHEVFQVRKGLPQVWSPQAMLVSQLQQKNRILI